MCLPIPVSPADSGDILRGKAVSGIQSNVCLYKVENFEVRQY